MDKKLIGRADLAQARGDLPGADSMGDEVIFWDSPGRIPAKGNPFRMEFVMASICTRGRVTFTIDTQERTIEANDLTLIPDGHVIESWQASDDYSGLCIMMSAGFFRETINNARDATTMILFSRMHPTVRLTQHEAETFAGYFSLLRTKAADTSNRFRRNVVKALIQAMFYDFSGTILRTEKQQGRQTRAAEIFAEFIKLVEKHFRQERRVSWYAGQMLISTKYLADSIKCASQHTPNEWIDKYVVLEMCLLLRNTSKSIKELAAHMNFPSQSFFGKYFKEHVGMTPMSYRKASSLQ